jgi:hypothetical protein
MTDSFIELSEDEFDDLFPLIQNHLNTTASWAFGDGPGCLFETYGEELEFVRRQDPLKVWTLVDGDDGDLYVISGPHFVNRVGNLISTVPIAEDVTMQVHIEMDHDEDPEVEMGASR